MTAELKAAIRLPDDSVVFITANCTREFLPMQTIGLPEAGDGKHHHVVVSRLKEDAFRVGQYAFSRAQAEILFSRLLTLIYGAK
jgi:hypothetical protein